MIKNRHISIGNAVTVLNWTCRIGDAVTMQTYLTCNYGIGDAVTMSFLLN